MEPRENRIEKVIEDFSRYIIIRLNGFNLNKIGTDREDIYQEIIIKICKSLDNGNDIRHLAAYIRKIVNSVVINQFHKSRQEGRILESQKQILPESSSGTSIPSTFEKDRLNKFLRQSIDELIDSRKMVMRLFLLDYDIGEIASLLKWSKRKTYHLFYRAVNDLKNKLRDKGILYED
jgi:RNA polymerase sigma factor (sigma-70 family)